MHTPTIERGRDEREQHSVRKILRDATNRVTRTPWNTRLKTSKRTTNPQVQFISPIVSQRNISQSNVRWVEAHGVGTHAIKVVRKFAHRRVLQCVCLLLHGRKIHGRRHDGSVVWRKGRINRLRKDVVFITFRQLRDCIQKDRLCKEGGERRREVVFSKWGWSERRSCVLWQLC